MPKWTKEQEEAIYKRGKNIIVSAGAGSGKTAVLSERVLNHLKNGAQIDKLLILTFTKAAAAEMKERIRKKIQKEESLASQLDRIDAAYITTFDAYALSLVKKYSHFLNVSRNVTIIDASVIELKKEEFLRQIFEEYYESNDLFLKLIGDFCLKDDNEVFRGILSLNSKLDNILDKKGFLNSYFDDFFTAKNLDNVVNEYMDYLFTKINDIKVQIKNIGFYTENGYDEKINEVLNGLLNASCYEDIRNNISVKLPNLPRGSYDEAKLIKKEISSLISELNELTIYDDLDAIKNTICKTRDYIEVIIQIINKLDLMVSNYKKEKNAYEFNDISHMALSLLKENKGIREELKNNYYEILIDEYQDTNDLQEEFISLIENNNVYMVGDIKQSIYRFRNTNPLLFKNKYECYSLGDKGLKIDLNKNFRSRSDVLSSINELFNVIMDSFIGGADYKVSHQMVYGNKAYEEVNEENYKLEIYNYEDDLKDFSKEEAEIFIIASDIKNKVNKFEVMDKETNLKRTCSYDDFVILIDRSSSFEKYKKIFEYLNIPLTIYRDKAITKSVDILLLKNIYSLLLNGFNNEYKVAFMSIARSYLFNMDDEEIFDIVTSCKYEGTLIYDIYQKLRSNLNEITNHDLCEKIFEEFNFYQKMVTDKNIEEHLVIIESLLKTASNCDKLGFTPLDFYNYLKDILENGYDVKLSLNKDSGNSVKIMTIHTSKGLEYPICYYAGLSKKFNISDLKEKFYFSSKYGFILPYFDGELKNTILKVLLKNSYIVDEISERMRLFYVALTRAREKMIIVTSLNENILSYKDDGVVGNDIRVKYRCFNDFLSSAYGTIQKYIKIIDLKNVNLTKNYNFTKKIALGDFGRDKLDVCEISLNNELLEKKHFSKEICKLNTKEEKNNIEFGLRMHSILENIDFANPDYSLLSDFEARKVKAFIDTGILYGFIDLYKEYEFMYTSDFEYHGIIDLLIIKENENIIVDYKLKHTDDEAYLKQLAGYKKYIQKINGKKTLVYLYSILDEKLINFDI